MHTIFKKACFLSQLTLQKPRNTFSSLLTIQKQQETSFPPSKQTKRNQKRRFQPQNKQKDLKNVVSVNKTHQT